LVAVVRTVEETTSVVGGPCVTQEQPPKDVLALQYEYINGGDFEEAYALFAEQTRREVSLAQYRAFFEDNAPYSVTDYSLVPVRVRGDSASVNAEFTVTSASGAERLERSQEFVCERGDWRVVMRPDQVAVLRRKRRTRRTTRMPTLPASRIPRSEIWTVTISITKKTPRRLRARH
jgi:hypothetical protein